MLLREARPGVATERAAFRPELFYGCGPILTVPVVLLGRRYRRWLLIL